MAWIKTEREDEWSGALSELYEDVVDRSYRRVDNVLQIHSLDPEGMKSHLSVYSSAMAGTKTLRKVEREIIAVVVSQINECDY